MAIELKDGVPGLPLGSLTFPALAALAIDYDKRHDMLSITAIPARPAVSIDIEGEVWLRVVRATGEVVGFEFEDFREHFLPRHPELAQAWRTTYPSRLGRTHEQAAAFLEQVLRWFQQRCSSEATEQTHSI